MLYGVTLNSYTQHDFCPGLYGPNAKYFPHAKFLVSWNTRSDLKNLQLGKNVIWSIPQHTTSNQHIWKQYLLLFKVRP